jgi:uridine phosphorylase
MQHSYPILEYDPTPQAIIEPGRVLKPLDIPQHCVVCFFQDVINQLNDEKRLTLVTNLRSEIGQHPVFQADFDGKPFVIFHPGVGAPLAAGLLEEMIALGCRKFIACGGSGVLDREIAVGHLVVPHSAVRDEGTSYHYLPPAREVRASPLAVEAIVQTLTAHHVEHLVSKTWTTDAIYRETPAKIKLRRDEGCLTVEMEAAAFFAVAQFRNVAFGQILYGGDDISGDVWDHRHWDKQVSVREKLFWLAAEACLLL